MKAEPREVWVQRVKRLADSGLTVREYAREIGVNVHTLAGWRWRLQREAVESPSSAAAKPPFVEVKTVATTVPSAAPAASAVTSSSGGVFEVVLGSGLRIRVPSPFDAAALRALLHALEAA
jgi:transposase-like protein